MAKDFNKLIGRIYEKFGTRTAFCNAIGKTPEWLSRRLNNQTEFDINEMILVMNTLEIDAQELHLYFLCPDVV